MTNVELERANPRRDLAAIGLVTLLVAVLCVRFEFGERFFAVTRQWEHFQVDELPAVLLGLVLALAWFAGRRYAQLDRLLLENRRLAQDHLRAQDAERKSLARELHDELGQYLNAIKTDAVAIQDRAADNPPVLRAASAIVGHADHVHGVVRDLIRKLRPVGLDELGLQAALEHSLDHWQQRLPALRFAASFEGDLDDLGEQIALVLYRLVQEGLTNLSTHARARSVRIRLARTRLPPDSDESIVFEMTDDGCGADLSGKQSGLGLIGMRERVEMLGGRLRIATEPAKGFSIVAHIPLSVRTRESS